MELTNSEKVVYSVHQIRILNDEMSPLQLATCFFIGLCDNGEQHIPVLVTNRHVLSAGPRASVTFMLADEKRHPIRGSVFNLNISTADAIYHPDPAVDLAILPVGHYLDRAEESGIDLFYLYLKTDLIPSPDDWKQFDAIESVIMAGYPKGLWDSVNNYPIVRRGITATHPGNDFMGAPCFLVDMPCFEGCSGSPVFIFNDGVFSEPRAKRITVGSRVFLLGIQYAVSTTSTTGRLDIYQSGNLSLKPVVPQYLNIGHVIKSSALFDFEPILREKFGITGSFPVGSASSTTEN